MEMIVVLVALALVAWSVRKAIAGRPLPATSDDWFVVFDINAEKKMLGLWFYPIVGFIHHDNRTAPLTSRPDYIKKLVASRPATRVNETMWGVSVSYGRWMRDGVPFDEDGNPEYQDGADFCTTVENHLLGDFKLHFATPVPVFYQRQVEQAVERRERAS